MLRRFSLGTLITAGLVLTVSISAAQGQKPKEPKWTHAFDLMVRKYKEAEFDDKKTQKFGVEVFKDFNTGYGIYISQKGSFGAAPGFAEINGPIEKSKGAKWVSGLDLPARKAGEKEFTEKTKVWAMEVFYDPNVTPGNWLYVTENAAVAATTGPAPAGGALKAPKWVHSVDLRCRKGGVRDWKDATPFGIEVYRDTNTSNLIYISDPGYIAVVPEGQTPDKTDKAPDWLHGLDLSCRRFNENDFTKDTKKWGVEVFRDENNGNLIYICESGAIAVVPGKKDLKAPTPNVKEPVWMHGLNLAAREYGEKEFTEKTRVWGTEIFKDDNTGVIIHINEGGALTVVPAK
jgi:hypothetical protein